MVSSISQKSENSQNSENKQIKQRKKWEFQQTKKYYEFLLRYRNILQQTEKKQKQRIYNRMADHVGTRTTHQCRSHHQKVMKRYSSIDNFIVEFRRKLQTLSNSQSLQGGTNLDQRNEKKRLKSFNKTKIKLSSGLQQQLKKLIQINRSSKQKQQIVEIIRTLKGLTGKKANYLNNQTNGEQNQSLFNGLKSNSYKKDKGLSQINCSQNSLPFNTLRNSQALEGSNRMQYSNDLRGPFNKYPSISNDQIDTQYEWVPRVFQNSNPYEQFKTNIFPPRENQIGTLYPDYSYVSFLMREMADKTLSSHSQSRPLQNFAYRQSPEQIIHNAAFICASVIQRENLNTINPYIKQNQIIVTPQKIQIPYKKDQNSNIFVQCVKVEQLSQDQMVNSNFQQMQREKIKQVLIQVLKKQGFFRNNSIIAQQYRHDFDISSIEIEVNKKQLQKPTFVQKKPKIQDNYKLKPQFLVHHGFDTLKFQVHEQYQKRLVYISQDEYMNNKIEGIKMNEELPKTAPDQQEAEKQSRNHYIKKSYENQGINKIPPYYEGIHQSQNQKRKQVLTSIQHRKRLSNFPPTQEPKNSFNYNSSPYPFTLSSSPPQYPNFFHVYSSDTSFPNYGYQPYSYLTHFQQQKIHYQNFPPIPFFDPQYTQTKENFPQKKKFK